MSDVREKVLWFAIGAAVGAGIALLYAPQTGRQTRRLIARKADEARETLVDSSEEILDRGRDLFEKGRKIAEEASDLFERGRQAVGA